MNDNINYQLSQYALFIDFDKAMYIIMGMINTIKIRNLLYK